eukprot:SAG22_NODE_1011_length_6041_cov_11.536856_5_plen_202_part_00
MSSFKLLRKIARPALVHHPRARLPARVAGSCAPRASAGLLPSVPEGTTKAGLCHGRLQIQRADHRGPPPPPPSAVELHNSLPAFGATFTDHMLTCAWTAEHGWAAPTIEPFRNIELHPAAHALHYAVEVFEGMKAYRVYPGAGAGSGCPPRLFRPDMHMARMNRSAARMLLPSESGADTCDAPPPTGCFVAPAAPIGPVHQ